MIKSIIGLSCGIILVALGLCLLLPGIMGSVGGISVGLLASLGALLLAGFILLLIFSGVGLLVVGILGLVGVAVLALALPFLAPLLIVIIPVALLIKLATKK